MELHSRLTIYFVLWLGNIVPYIASQGKPLNEFASITSEERKDEAETVTKLGLIIPVTEVTDYASDLNETKGHLEHNHKENLTNCSTVQVENSFPTLRCHDVLAFNKYPFQENTNIVAVEIDWVGGDFSLPQELRGVHLESLKISEANLTSLFYNSSKNQKVNSLKRLDISGNPEFDAQCLVNIEFPDLTHLFMNGSALVTLDDQLQFLLQKITKLEYLDVSYAGISYLDDPEMFDSNTELKHLNVAGNKISVVTFHTDTLYHLNYLNMSRCNLRRIKVQDDNVMGNFQPQFLGKSTGYMEVLDVSSNRLKEIPPALLYALHEKCYLMNISNNAFREASENCQTYYLWHFLQSLPTDPSGCTSGSIHRMEVTGKDELKYAKRKALRKCTWNSCPSGCQCDSKKKIVDCSNMGLSSLPVVAPSEAEVLLLPNNSLTTLENIESPAWCNLITIDVGYNNISNIFPSRKVQGNCNCSPQGSYSIEQTSCLPQNLKKLLLNNNIIKNFTKNDCSLLMPLHDLDLAGNKIKSLAPGCDGPLESLETLKLSQNEISNKTDHYIYQFPRLKTLIICVNSSSVCTEIDYQNLLKGSLNKILNDQIEIMMNKNDQTQVSTSAETSQNSSATTNQENNTINNSTTQVSSSTSIPNRTTPITPTIAPSNEDEPSDSTKRSEFFMTLVAIVLLLIICVLTCYNNYWRNVSDNIKRKFGPAKSVSSRKKYDCFVVCSSRDFRQVRERVIIPLTQRGYSIAWHDNAFVPGDWIMHNVERAVQNSSRMLVFCTANLVSSRWGLHEIRRGRHEEFVDQDFKVMAMVTRSLPRNLNRDLYEIVCLRTHIKLTDRDYIEQVCRFLPPQDPAENTEIPPDGVYMTMHDISDLLKRYEEIRHNEYQNSSIRLAELFHTHRDRDKFSLRVDIATKFSTHVCDNKALCSICQNERSAMIQRFKAISYSSNTINCTDTSSLQEYVLDADSGQDITELLDEENMSRTRKRTLTL